MFVLLSKTRFSLSTPAKIDKNPPTACSSPIADSQGTSSGAGTGLTVTTTEAATEVQRPEVLVTQKVVVAVNGSVRNVPFKPLRAVERTTAPGNVGSRSYQVNVAPDVVEVAVKTTRSPVFIVVAVGVITGAVGVPTSTVAVVSAETIPHELDEVTV